MIEPNLSTLPARNPEHNPLAILARCKKEKRPAFIAGPMVRYSKLPFRELLRQYKCDIVYSPMILAREFVRNDIARYSDFTTNERDRSLIVQIGCNNVTDLLRMCEMIYPYVDGIGLNCGCPVKEQVREGIGAALMSTPEKVAELVSAVKSKYGDKLCMETKIRIHDDLQETVRFAKIIEKAGVDFITVHGRTKTTRSSQPANFDAIKLIKENVSCPVVANGDCFSLEDAYKIANYTNADGIMAVRGILANPALFAGFSKTPWGAIEKFWDLASSYGLPFRLLQHHMDCMLEGQIDKALHLQLMDLKSTVEMVDWFDENFDLKRNNEPGFGERIEIPSRKNRLEMSHI
ncbi:hypothetical protein PACTADRAFT_69603 [Pachysolen tannophilus NRRL Y-2460]|uniref:tRNA-dihydrouridine synthase n=1 Tax=Pachysolen tannophilus NRRL Y-2460 TaxID=669874 RepID=A0A1E4TSF7_PACTA|nr:hypothetical protein PACTADRAFT_69603 [Pachysolen tannophilus NRRL Y-2460]